MGGGDGGGGEGYGGGGGLNGGKGGRGGKGGIVGGGALLMINCSWPSRKAACRTKRPTPSRKPANRTAGRMRVRRSASGFASSCSFSYVVIS